MCANTMNIAHRGARSLAPENTLAAARKAPEVGAGMWKLDVAMTCDGELFLRHDDALDRTSNVEDIFPNRRPWFNHLFTLAEIRQLDSGSRFVEEDPFKQIAAGRVARQEAEKYVGETPPTLRDALVFTRDSNWRVNVEIKDLNGTPGDATVVEKLVSMIQELGMVDRVLISSFNHSYLGRARQADDDITLGALVSQAQVDPPAFLRCLDAQAYNPQMTAIKPAEIRGLRDQGFDVYIWTVNDQEAMRSLVRAGVSGIFTDFPQLLKPILDECRP